MKPSEVIITMKHAFEADCIPFIWGSPGIGKSMIAELASDHFFGPEDAEEKTKFMNKYEKAQYRKDYLLELRLGNKDLIDTTGSVKTTDDNWTIQCLPRFWEVTSKGKGMIMLDEANQTTKTMEKVLQQICDGRIGEWVKRHEWKIVCIGNNVSDKALARKLGTQFANRVFHIDYDVDNDEWIDWYFSMNLPFLVPAYITAKPDALFDFDPKKSEKGWSSPRSWHGVGRLLATNPPGHLLFEMVKGMVGEARAIEFIGFAKVHTQLPDIKGIIATPHDVDVPLDPNVLYQVTEALAKKATPDNFANILAYAKNMPKEFTILLVTRAKDENPSIQQTKAFIEWGVKNQDVTI